MQEWSKLVLGRTSLSTHFPSTIAIASGLVHPTQTPVDQSGDRT